MKLLLPLLAWAAAAAAAGEPPFEACSGRGLATGSLQHEVVERLSVLCDEVFDTTVLEEFRGWEAEEGENAEAPAKTGSTTVTDLRTGRGTPPPRHKPAVLAGTAAFQGQVCDVERTFSTRLAGPVDALASCSGGPVLKVGHVGQILMRAGFPSVVTSAYGVRFAAEDDATQGLGASVVSTLTELPQSVSERAKEPGATYSAGKVVVPEKAHFVWSRSTLPEGPVTEDSKAYSNLGSNTFTRASAAGGTGNMDSDRLSYLLTLTRGKRTARDSAYAVLMRLAPLEVTGVDGSARFHGLDRALHEAAAQAAYTAGANPSGLGIELIMYDSGVVVTPTRTPVLYEQAARLFETRLARKDNRAARNQFVSEVNRGLDGKPLSGKGGAGSVAADAFLEALATGGVGVEKRINLFGGNSDAGAADGGLADNAKAGRKGKAKNKAEKAKPSPVQASVTFKARYGTPGQDFGRKAREAKAKAKAEAEAAGFLEVEERDGMLVATGDAKSLRAMAGFEVQLSLWSSVINLGAFYLKAQAAGGGGKWKRGWVGNVLGVELQSDQALAEGTGGPLVTLGAGAGAPPPVCGAASDAGLPTVEVFKREDDEMFGKTFGPVVVGGVPLEFTLKVGGALELHAHAGSCKAADGSTRAVVGVKPVATLLAGASAGVTAGIASAGAYLKSKLVDANGVGGVSIGGGSADAGTSVCGGVQPDVSFGGGEAGVYVDSIFTEPATKPLFAWGGRKSEWVGKRSACKCGLVGRDQCAASDAACSTCAKKAPALAPLPREATGKRVTHSGFGDSRYAVRSPLRQMQAPHAGHPGVSREGECAPKHLYHALLDLMKLAHDSLPADVLADLATAPAAVKRSATFFRVPLQPVDGINGAHLVKAGSVTMAVEWPHDPRLFTEDGYTALLLVRQAAKLFMAAAAETGIAMVSNMHSRFWMTHYHTVASAAAEFAREEQTRPFDTKEVHVRIMQWFNKCQRGLTNVEEL